MLPQAAAVCQIGKGWPPIHCWPCRALACPPCAALPACPQGVLALNVPVPGLRRHFLLTKTLEWNLYW